jgi:hypothetical protein
VHTPGELEKRPGPQSLHCVDAEAPADDVLPAGQEVQVVAAVAPVAVEKVPAAQSVHTAAPVVAMYLPATQERQTVATVAPTVVEYLPVVQSVQDVPAVVVLYLPATQSVQAVAPVLENVPMAQSVHTVDAHAPMAAEYLPAAQPVQTAPPVVLR